MCNSTHSLQNEYNSSSFMQGLPTYASFHLNFHNSFSNLPAYLLLSKTTCSLFIPDSIQTLLSLYKPFYFSTCKIPPDPNNPPSIKLYLILQVNVNFSLPLYSHFALLFSDWLFLFFSDWLFIFHLIAKDGLFSFLLSSLIIHFLRARTLFFFPFCRKLHYFFIIMIDTV